MKVATRTLAFRKTAACPASTTLLSFRSNSLSGDAVVGVRDHLELCDFCSAELPLLAHHQPARIAAYKVPEIPMNLRILAESILGQISKVRDEEVQEDLQPQIYADERGSDPRSSA